MYCRKARMAETVQEIIEDRKTASRNAAVKFKHPQNDDLKRLIEKNRQKFGTTIPKPEPTDNIENTVWSTVDQWRFKRYVLATDSRAHSV